jgi:hypothetical protein
MRTLHARAATSRVVALALFALAAGDSPLGAQQRTARISLDSLTSALANLRGSADSAWIPATATFAFGDSTIAANHHSTGPVAIAGGTLDVRGVIAGDAVVYSGDIVVHQGGVIHGNAYAILGKVVLNGGVVDGDIRSLSGDLRRISTPAGAAVRSPSSRTMHALALLCVGLALTSLGALLIPFALVAYILAAAGLVTLGLLAIARIAGGTVLGADEGGLGAHRTAALRSMVYGLLLLMIPWFAAGALSWSPKLELVARMVAVAVTWVAATAGLGAAVISRGGVRRTTAPAAQRALNTASWATPTPVAGVTAARRPTPYTTSAPK